MSVRSLLNQLIDDRIEQKKLGDDKQKSSIGETTGTGEAGEQYNAGISSPLSETNRTITANTVIQSSDGFFTLVLNPLKSITFNDADGNPAKFNFK